MISAEASHEEERSAIDLATGRLWSLWDLMVKFDVRLLIVRLNYLEQLEKELRGQMPLEDRPLEPQMQAFGLPMWTSGYPDAFTTKEGRRWIWAYLGPMLDEMKPLGLVVGPSEIQDIWNHADRWTRSQLADGFAALRRKIEAELNEKFFLFLSSEEAALFSNSEPFGSSVAVKFPSANAELIEAAQCIALDKGTAAVFHSMRAVESGIGAIAQETGHQFDKTENWNDIINKIESTLKGWQKNGIAELSLAEKNAKLEYLGRAASEIRYFKDGWRNYVSHNKRPYGTNEAKDVFQHVGRFIAVLSEQLFE